MWIESMNVTSKVEISLTAKQFFFSIRWCRSEPDWQKWLGYDFDMTMLDDKSKKFNRYLLHIYKQSKSLINKQTKIAFAHLLTNEFNFKTNPKNTNQQSYFDVFLFATISYANRLWIKKQVRIDWFPLQCCFACVCQHLNLTFY